MEITSGIETMENEKLKTQRELFVVQADKGPIPYWEAYIEKQKDTMKWHTNVTSLPKMCIRLGEAILDYKKTGTFSDTYWDGDEFKWKAEDDEI